MNCRDRARTSVSIGSNQLSKRSTASSVAGCKESGVVIDLFMAWSPVRRFNAGRFEVHHPGDYANPNFYQLRDGTNGSALPLTLGEGRGEGLRSLVSLAPPPAFLCKSNSPP